MTHARDAKHRGAHLRSIKRSLALTWAGVWTFNIAVMLLVSACGIPAAQQEATTALPVPVAIYDIVEVEDISLAHAVRFSVKVTTEFPISTEQIGALCEEVVENLQSQGSLNAVAVFLYDTRSLVSWGYSIAKCEYAPNGVWADAGNVQRGDYSTHKYAYEYQPKVVDGHVAVSERPTEQEYNLCQQWDELTLELLFESDDVATAETIAYERIAVKNGVSIQIVEDALVKCTAWTWR